MERTGTLESSEMLLAQLGCLAQLVYFSKCNVLYCA